jgi:ABC-type sugar transport system ATPase subunit
MAHLQLVNIHKGFGSHKVITDLSLEIRSGEFITLLGPSGCGKTTLLRMIAGLEIIDQGELRIAGTRYNDIPAQKRPIAMVFQSYALFPHLSVKDNILFGLKIQKKDVETMGAKLEWVMPLLRLQGLEKRLPKEISGGQRQRVALARALVLDPQVLLLDEPLSNLDTALRDTAMEELQRIHRKVGKTIVYVTHNQAEAMVMSERVVVMNGGRVEQCDTPVRVYDEPHTLFAAGFIGSPAINLFDGILASRGECFGVETAMGFLVVDKDRAAMLLSLCGKMVTVGLRPQNIFSVSDVSGRRFSDTEITITIELVQPLGERSLVVGRANEGRIIRFLMSRDETIACDQQIKVVIDGRKILVFDLETAINLFNPVPYL